MDSTTEGANGQKPRRVNGRVICSCSCHGTCHTCGNPFYGNLPHINCADWGTESFNAQNYTHQRKGV